MAKKLSRYALCKDKDFTKLDSSVKCLTMYSRYGTDSGHKLFGIDCPIENIKIGQIANCKKCGSTFEVKPRVPRAYSKSRNGYAEAST